MRDIEMMLHNSLDKEVPSYRIGELAMEKLRAIDEVAYVRFASVYRQFKDIDSFMKELQSLLEARAGRQEPVSYTHLDWCGHTSCQKMN